MVIKPLTIAMTANRIQSGLESVIAIKEHIDYWNKYREPSIFIEEPVFMTNPDHHWLDAWLAGAAEFEAFLIGIKAPEWAQKNDRFLKKPFLPTGENAKKFALIETPFSWRKRMVFTGKTTIR